MFFLFDVVTLKRFIAIWEELGVGLGMFLGCLGMFLGMWGMRGLLSLFNLFEFFLLLLQVYCTWAGWFGHWDWHLLQLLSL